LKILFTTYQGDLAGSTFSVIYLAKGLSENGYEIHIACPKKSLLFSELADHTNIKCHDVQFSGYFDMYSARSLAGICHKVAIDVVCAQSGRDRNLSILAKWIFRSNTKLVFIRRQRPRDEPFLKRWVHTRATSKIILVSNGLKTLFLKKGYPESHLQVIHNGVDVELFTKEPSGVTVRELKTALGLDKEMEIGCVSRFKHQKILIEALASIPEDVIIIFIGTSRRQLQDVFDKVKPKQRIICIDEVERELLPAYYRLMSVSVLASKMDGFGLVLVESMLSGVPVVASDFGGIPDVIQHNKTGLLFQNDNPKQLAQQLSDLLTNADRCQVLTQNARRTAIAKFDIQKTITIYDFFFRNL